MKKGTKITKHLRDNSRARKHFFSEDYFDKIDTEEKAYWLGFIYADGYIKHRKGAYALTIGLSSKDHNHVVKFANAVGYDSEIKIRTDKLGYKNSTITLYSKKMVISLLRCGLYQNKSLTIEPWSGPEHLMKAYWLGVFDGDGGFCKNVKKLKNGTSVTRYSFNLYGTFAMVDGLKKFISRQELCKGKGTIREHYSIWRLYYGGTEKTQKISNFMYLNMDTFLQRKKDIADEIEKILFTKYKIRDLDENMLLKLFHKLGSWEKVAYALKISRNGLYKHLRRSNMPRRKWVPKNVTVK
jgi:hypothetical protein